MNYIPKPPTLDTFISTLFHSWGSDTPPEVFWAFQDFINYINDKYDMDLQAPTEDEYYREDTTTYEAKMQIIKEALANLP